MSFTAIVPGQVRNQGIGDDSRPIVSPQLATYPCNFPVIGMVTPKGPLGQKYINTGSLGDIYGDVQDTDGPYYNPIAALIHSLSSGGQASLGMRRLTANTELARVAVGVKVVEADIQQYKRDASKHFILDESGARIPVDSGTTTYQGRKITPMLLDISNTEYKGLKPITGEGAEGEPGFTIYPLYELPAGIGDVYNRMGHYAGLSGSADFARIAEFVNQFGVFPFNMKLYEKSIYGTPVIAKTLNNTEEVTFTLFDTRANNVRYGVKEAIGAYTGATANRPMTPRPAPFYEAHVYHESIEALAKDLFAVEEATMMDNLVYLEGVKSYKQINPLTAVNHEGIPYYAIEVDAPTRLFNMGAQLDATGGISPFLTKELQPPEGVTLSREYNFDATKGQVEELNRKDAWAVTQALVLADLMKYRKSLEILDWTRNRQSIIFDVGFNSDIVDEQIQLLATRKDHAAVFASSEWLKNATIEEHYSRQTYITNRLRLIPESEKYGTPSCRAMIAMWEMNKINEESGERFSHVLDIAYAMALFGGNAQGQLLKANSPDHANNRLLRTMYDPTVDIEADPNAANNFDNGACSLRPYNQEQLYRPALPTIYPHHDSVLKDWVNVFTAISVEKIIQDTWTLVSGDTTITADEYAAIVKDRAETKCRKDLGTMFEDLVVEPTYNEGAADSRSVLYVTGYVSFRKGKYMMDMSLIARNEQDTAAEG
ncbi:putative tail sheath protein [Vibrio phage phiKT1019]|nr:putative tail sheath protein [Vibrio phage phiKT1019]